jgi:hypothetical protein
MSSNHLGVWLRTVSVRGLLGVSALVIACLPALPAHAAGNDFSVQVSPSPLVVNPSPGKNQTATLTIRNFSTHTESLSTGLSGLKIEDSGRKVSPHGPIPGNMDAWVKFSQSRLIIAPGGSVPLTVTFAPPNDVGFSYAAAITLTSTDTTIQSQTGATLRPEVDVFCLVNINRPDARAELSIAGFSASKSHYNFLPADFSLTVENKGNVIEQPTGNIFIQRSFDDPTPIATLQINGNGGYVLPDSLRTFDSQWSAGFPSYIAGTDGKVHLRWDWKHVSELRFGRYVAKAVLVYNNGKQDVPLIASFTFWVIPWWLLVTVILSGALLISGLVGWGWLLFKGTKKVRGYAAHHKK